ncbi:MAG: ComEC/Rec2 family competence protein [Cyanobacteria bacterium P01_D01_bin.44]
MAPWGLLLLCGSYLLGLFSTGLMLGGGAIPFTGYGILGLGMIGGLIVPRYWRMGPTRQQWIVAGIVGMLGAAYCVWRIPKPGPDDVSRFLHNQDSSGPYEVVGKVQAVLQPTRDGNERFWLQVESVQDRSEDAKYVSRQPASGKLYVTASSKDDQELFPGKQIKVGNFLREPDTAKRPGEFDLKHYLAKQGCFAKLEAYYIEEIGSERQSKPRLWQIRQRIVKAQGRWLKAPKGDLLSAMTLGRKAVDVPHEVRDSFIEAGLAHTMAASGFHVSLVLALVLTAMRSQLPRVKFIAGTSALAGYIGLTGLQPSVLRAGIMGFGVLVGLVLQRQVKPLGCLFLAVNVLLVYNPQWIWDVGFQLSVFATLGLMVTVSPLVKRLDWLPVTIATAVAVPLAAYAWTIPLQLYHFGVMPSYSIVLNMVATPLVVVISMGGFVSAFGALVWPMLGSAIAWLLAIPIQILMGLVHVFNQLPGHQLELGKITAWQVLLSYGVYAAVSLWLAHRYKAN